MTNCIIQLEITTFPHPHTYPSLQIHCSSVLDSLRVWEFRGHGRQLLWFDLYVFLGHAEKYTLVSTLQNQYIQNASYALLYVKGF